MHGNHVIELGKIKNCGDGEVAQQNTYRSCKRPRFGSQNLQWAAYNHLELQLIGA